MSLRHLPALVLPLFLLTAAAYAGPAKGDVNLDGDVTVGDLVAVVQQAPLLFGSGTSEMDVAPRPSGVEPGDGALTPADLWLFLQVMVYGEDVDGDGLVDELGSSTSPLDLDSDDDGLCDGQGTVDHGICEFGEVNTDPASADTDQDGLCDGRDRGPVTDHTGTVVCTGGEDLNANGVLDPGETDPADDDTDDDALLDGEELQVWMTDPRLADTDMDGIHDGAELAVGLDPNLGADGDAFGYLAFRSHAGDTHVHSGTPESTLTGWSGLHAWRWCDYVYQVADTNGLDWVLLTNHDSMMTETVPNPHLTNWRSIGVDYSSPGYPDDIYPTHPDGYPNYDGAGGRTLSLVESFFGCAQSHTQDGAFVGLYGIEFSGANACIPDQPCGGHKTVVFRNRPAKACIGSKDAETWEAPSELCDSVKALYDVLAATGGVANMAHIGNPEYPQIILPLNVTGPGADNGGIDDTFVKGVETTWGTEHPTQPIQNDYRDVLAQGHKVHPAFGSDYHFKREGSPDQWSQQELRRTMCWSPGLTQSDIIDAMEANRCYFATTDSVAQFTVDGLVMGSKVSSSSVDPVQGLTVRLLAFPKVSSAAFASWELLRGGIGVKATPVLSGDCDLALPGQSAPQCMVDVNYVIPNSTSSDYEGYYYIEVDGSKKVITAPVWIQAP